jgi:3-oxoacyl-[acyl-carrier protein] reductase
MFRLDGRVALVTGASRGIGRAVAQALAAQGATVAINFARSEEQARELAESLAARGARAELLPFDVADSAQVDAAVAGLAQRAGRLDILVANAGIALDGLLLRASDADLDRMVAVNLRGAFACARAALKTMMRARWGRVVFVSSVVGETGNAGQAAYAATKAGLLGLARSLAREYGSRGVTVNAVAPGLVETDMTARIPQKAKEAVRAQIPAGRLGTPADVAAAVAFLCSEDASYVTGQVLRVNGGMHM